MSAPIHPVVYGAYQDNGQAPPPGYGQAPPQGYGQAPPQGYGQAPPQGYGQAPPQGYDQAPPPGGYPVNGAAPPNGYNYAPPPGSNQGYYPPPGSAQGGYYPPPGQAPGSGGAGTGGGGGGYYAPPGSVVTPVQPYGGIPQQQLYPMQVAPPGAVPYGASGGYPPQQQQQQQPPPGYYYPPPDQQQPGAPQGYPPQQLPPPGGGYAPPQPAYPIATVVATPVAGQPVDPNKQAHVNPRNQIEQGRWAEGLFGCFNNCIPNFCMATCCPCVSLAQVQARIGMASYRVALLRLGTLTGVMVAVRFAMPQPSQEMQVTMYQDANGNWQYQYTDPPTVSIAVYMVSMVVQLVFIVAVITTRLRVRSRFKIPGSCCEDCVVSWCCACCAIAQMASHVKSYKPGSCDFGGPDVLSPFT